MNDAINEVFGIETNPAIAAKERIRQALMDCGQRQHAKAEAEQRRIAGVGRGVKRFSTQAAVDWGRRQGWLLMEREHYDHRTKRHHDCILGSDCVFKAPSVSKTILVQAAGKSERAEHYRRFEDRGGKTYCDTYGFTFIYLEFERGNADPVKREEWV